VVLEVVIADIVTLNVDAMVNSANKSLLAGSGVCGAIHRAAGIELEKACKEIVPCEEGKAVITSSFNLPCRFIIHAVAPKWLGRANETELLELCYHSIFKLAREYNIKTIAVPAIGTGINGFSVEVASEIAIKISKDYEASFDKIIFACIDIKTAKNYSINLI
jgi:O-acetyl-ADP-ribose deacetylase (regulator of RNase III)